MTQKKNKSALIIFTRIPEYGKTKTRLEPFLGCDNCVNLHTNMLKDLKENLKSICYDIYVFYTGNIENKYILKDIFTDIELCEQKGEDIWEKMYFSIFEIFSKGYAKVILIGADIPLIDNVDIESSFNELDNKDVVISPTLDGGYCLIGMKKPHKSIFDSSLFLEGASTVSDILLEKLEKEKITYYLNDRILDLDVEEDIRIFLNMEDSRKCVNTFNFLNAFMIKEGL